MEQLLVAVQYNLLNITHFRVMTANSSEGVVEADVMRQFLLQCADNYGHHRPSSIMPPSEDGGSEMGRSSSRMGLGSRLEDIRRRERELELEEMLQALDLDQDGKVSLNDFIRLLILDQNGVGEEETNRRVEAKDSNKNTPTREDTNDITSSNERKRTIIQNVEDDNEYQSRTKGCFLM